jgi:hypothetical protein
MSGDAYVQFWETVGEICPGLLNQLFWTAARTIAAKSRTTGRFVVILNIALPYISDISGR